MKYKPFIQELREVMRAMGVPKGRLAKRVQLKPDALPDAQSYVEIFKPISKRSHRYNKRPKGIRGRCIQCFLEGKPTTSFWLTTNQAKKIKTRNAMLNVAMLFGAYSRFQICSAKKITVKLLKSIDVHRDFTRKPPAGCDTGGKGGSA
jgi:hypothetical protein